MNSTGSGKPSADSAGGPLFERLDEKDFTCIRLRGRSLDFTSSRELKTRFTECKQQHVERVILDLSECSYLSSEGIGLLLYIWQFYKNDGKIFIVLRDESIIDTLNDCGFLPDMRENIRGDYAAAARAIGGGESREGRKPGRVCPKCKSTNIARYDRGLKRLSRLLKRKPVRHVCRDCWLVWRKK